MNGTLTNTRTGAAGVSPAGGSNGSSGTGRTPTAAAPAGLLSDRVRPLRFVLVGGLCGSVQLGLLAAFLAVGWRAIPANAVAFLLSAQLNFALSRWFIWHDRRSQGLGRRWWAFHGSIAGTALLNQCVFVVAQMAVPDLIAAALGIGTAAVINFLVQDRLVFRGRREAPTTPADA